MSEFHWREKCLVTKDPKTQREFFFQKYFDAFRRAAGARDDILEIGCGRGTIGCYFAEEGKRVTLADIAPEAVDLARQNLARLNLPGRALQADALRLPFADKSFSVICSVGMIEHLEGDGYRACLAECYRVLKEDGAVCFINGPKKFSIQTFFVKHDHYHREAFTADDYARACRDAGFRKVEYFYINPFPLIETKRELFWTRVFQAVYWLRGRFLRYPMRSNKLISQGHFLIAVK
ncbi:MAG: class I SAM-dependent methyltransferase [Patescibacteria group bacterium]